MHVPWHRPCCKSDLPLVGPGDQVSIWVKHFYKGGRCGRVSLVNQMEPCMHVHAPCHFTSTIHHYTTFQQEYIHNLPSSSSVHPSFSYSFQ